MTVRITTKACGLQPKDQLKTLVFKLCIKKRLKSVISVKMSAIYRKILFQWLEARPFSFKSARLKNLLKNGTFGD